MPTVKHLIHLDAYKNRCNNEYYDCQFNLDKPYYNVKKCRLLSLEMPIGFCNIHEGINEYRLCIEGFFYSFFVPVGTYNNVNEIVEKLASMLNSATFHGSFISDISFIGTPYVHAFVVSNFLTDNWYVCDTPLSNLILGLFSTDEKIAHSFTVKAQNKPCLNIDNYVSMHILELGTNSNDSKITYKIPMPLTTFGVMFYAEHMFYPQEIYRDISTLTTLNIKFYDRFNNPLISNGYSWSGTLELTCEE